MVTLIEVDANDPMAADMVAECVVSSASEDGKAYRLWQGPGGGWQHADASCIGWLISGARGECRHVKELTMTTETQDAEQQEVRTKALRIMEHMDDQAIVKAVRGDVQAAWAYRFQVGDQQIECISVDGVQERLGLWLRTRSPAAVDLAAPTSDSAPEPDGRTK